ncbi:MAG: type II toxin-antitoxin system VapC family toxin [Egibacteraceae bacterium]
MTLVIDASVAVRWFVDGPYQDQARSLRHADVDFFAPTLLIAEAANVMWQLARAGQVSRPDAGKVLALLASGTPELFRVPPLIRRAFALAMELDHSVYDCIYLALAEEHHARVVTADRRFAHRGAGHGVVWIEDLE